MKDEHNFFWLVGLLEGEGSFLKPSPSKPNEPKIDLEMKDLDAIQRVAALFGLSYRTRVRKNKPNASTTYHVRLTGRRAVQLMWRIRPYLTERRQRQILAAVTPYAARGDKYDPTKLPRFEFQPVCVYPLCTAPLHGKHHCLAHSPQSSTHKAA